MEWLNEVGTDIKNEDNNVVEPMCGAILAAVGVGGSGCVLTGLLCGSLCLVYGG